MRVALPHLGQSVLLEVSITFLRSAVFAILAIFLSSNAFYHTILRTLTYSSDVVDFDNRPGIISEEAQQLA
jgi:hypothetical protein